LIQKEILLPDFFFDFRPAPVIYSGHGIYLSWREKRMLSDKSRPWGKNVVATLLAVGGLSVATIGVNVVRSAGLMQAWHAAAPQQTQPQPKPAAEEAAASSDLRDNLRTRQRPSYEALIR
jgi:hypothetical protein